MKKTIITILTLVLLLGCLTPVVSASSWPTLSEDLQTLTIDGETYHRFNTTTLLYDIYEEMSLELSETQKEIFLDGSVYFSPDKIIADVTIRYKDGASISAGYVKDSAREQMEDLTQNKNMNGSVEFYWPEEITVSAPMEDFKGEAVELDSLVLDYCNFFQVYGSVSTYEIITLQGSLLEEQGELYYVDFSENPRIVPDKFFPHEYTSLKGYKIPDGTLKSQLTKAIDAYYSDGLGVLYDDDFSEKLSTVLLIFLFAGIPSLILIWSVVLLIRSKGYQRKTWAVTAGMACGTLVVFAIVTAMMISI